MKSASEKCDKENQRPMERNHEADGDAQDAQDEE